MESKKQLLNKATDAYINIFTGTRHQRKKHINDNEDIIPYIESELRIINVGMVTSSIFMAGLIDKACKTAPSQVMPSALL